MKKVKQMESKPPLSQIIHTLMEGIVIENCDGQIVFANPALEQLLGYEQEELIGLHWTDLIPTELREQIQARRSTGAERTTSPFETCLRRKDGTPVRVRVNIRPLFDGNRFQATLVAVIPLDGQHHPVEEMALIGQHLSSVLHELNNPLTLILLQIRLLLKSAAQVPEIGEGLVTIQEQSLRMRRLVDELLAFGYSRPLQLEETDLNSLLRHTLDLQRLVQEEPVQVIADLSADLPTIQVDPGRLQQVFVNILNNAYQAIAEVHDVTKGATQKAGKVTVTTALVHNGNGHKSWIQIRFADNGTGIRPEVMPHLFEPFFTTRKMGEGIGLGLSICDRIAREHGGRMWAENNGEGGATFVLELPVIRHHISDDLAKHRPAPAER